MQNLRDRETLIALDKEHLWHPFTQMRDWLAENPVIIERGDGVYLFDIDGNRYIDGICIYVDKRPRTQSSKSQCCH